MHENVQVHVCAGGLDGRRTRRLEQVWFKWFKRAWHAYADAPQLAGISLQKQHLIATSGQ